uniref:Uncharacterized protein n=1 Tax=Romanomermis culicivorax TaxID=13658 RepID=A0A915ILR1_ROMCU
MMDCNMIDCLGNFLKILIDNMAGIVMYNLDKNLAGLVDCRCTNIEQQLVQLFVWIILSMQHKLLHLWYLGENGYTIH